MAIYVDGLRKYPGWKWRACHLTADTPDELRAAARALGLKWEWLQRSALGRKMHFDIPADRREAAIKMGAVVLRGEGAPRRRR